MDVLVHRSLGCWMCERRAWIRARSFPVAALYLRGFQNRCMYTQHIWPRLYEKRGSGEVCPMIKMGLYKYANKHKAVFVHRSQPWYGPP